MCEGDENTCIFEKVKNATLMVKEGKAAYERDGFLFYEKEYYLRMNQFMKPIIRCTLFVRKN